MKLFHVFRDVAHFMVSPPPRPPEVTQAIESTERVKRASAELAEKQDIFADLVRGLKGASFDGKRR